MAIKEAAAESQRTGQIVHIKVDSKAAAVSELRAVYETAQVAVDYCDLGAGDDLDIWAYDIDAPEGEMIWRLGIAQD